MLYTISYEIYTKKGEVPDDYFNSIIVTLQKKKKAKNVKISGCWVYSHAYSKF